MGLIALAELQLSKTASHSTLFHILIRISCFTCNKAIDCKLRLQILMEGMLETICKCVGRPIVTEDNHVDFGDEETTRAVN